MRLQTLSDDSPPELRQIGRILKNNGMSQLVDSRKGASTQAIDFFRSYDSGFRIRRLQMLAKSLNEGPSPANKNNIQGVEAARKGINSPLSYIAYVKTKYFPILSSKNGSRMFFGTSSITDIFERAFGFEGIRPEAEEILARILGSVPKDLRKSL